MMNLRRTIMIVMLIGFMPTLHSQTLHHESLAYQMYYINTYRTGILFLTGSIDLKEHLLKIEYVPRTGRNDIKVNAYLGEIIGDFEDIKIIDSLTININPLKYLEKSKSEILKVNNLRKGIKLIIWVNEMIPNRYGFVSMNKIDILKYAKVTLIEQERLAEYGCIKGAEELLIEVGRNCEE